MGGMVFISGAAGGFGRTVAAECARRGFDLLLTDMNDERLRVLAAALRPAYGVRVETVPCDLSDMSCRTALFETARGLGIRLRMLVNVAGADREGLFLDRSRDELVTMVRVNVESTLDLTRMLFELRDPAHTFRVVNVCSLAGFYPMPVKAVYAATKRLLIDLSLSLAEEFSEHDATVTALCPAGMPTTEESRRGIEAQGLMGRLTTLGTGVIAARTIDHALRGKRIYIPGALNRLLRGAGVLLPPVLISKIIGRRWKSAVRRRGEGTSPPCTAASDRMQTR